MHDSTLDDRVFLALFDDRLSIIILTSCLQETTSGNSNSLILLPFSFFAILKLRSTSLYHRTSSLVSSFNTLIEQIKRRLFFRRL